MNIIKIILLTLSICFTSYSYSYDHNKTISAQTFLNKSVSGMVSLSIGLPFRSAEGQLRYIKALKMQTNAQNIIAILINNEGNIPESQKNLLKNNLYDSYDIYKKLLFLDEPQFLVLTDEKKYSTYMFYLMKTIVLLYN